jgi:hypothetical protein
MCASWSGWAPKAPAECELEMAWISWREQTCLFIPAAHNEIYHLITVQRIPVSHDQKSSQAPVHRIHPQVSREVIRQFIFALLEGLDISSFSKSRRTNISKSSDICNM